MRIFSRVRQKTKPVKIFPDQAKNGICKAYFPDYDRQGGETR